MKILLAISSWPPSAENGDHQSSRDTWLKYAIGLDYRFFMGDGTPVSENDDLINAAWDARPSHYRDKLSESIPVSYLPKDDEVLLPCPYDFKHLPFKVREIFRWAKERDYDYIFKVDTDTFVDVPRLLCSGFKIYDYAGFPFHIDDISYASGGAGYWVSKHSYSLLVDEPISIPWDDIWVGQGLLKHGIRLHEDSRYNVCYPNNFHSGPRPDNDSITSHLGFSPKPFSPESMFEANLIRYPKEGELSLSLPERKSMSSAFDFIESDTLIALDILHDACTYVRDSFDVRMSRDEAKANLDARAILFNCSNRIFKEHDCAISKEEVEGARIIKRELKG